MNDSAGRMKAETEDSKKTFTELLSLKRVMREEWRWWIPASIFTFLLASILLSGWPKGLIPNLAFPYVYQGDGLSHSWMIQRLLEGWMFDNPRSGYPFGSNFLDYPGSDIGNLLVLKLLGVLTGNYAAALNLYFLIGFPVAFAASYLTLRTINLSKPLAVSASILFVFLPFHFLRLGHLFYTWYFVVPLFFYIGFYIFYDKQFWNDEFRRYRNLIFLSAVLVCLASFGVYYALFGIIVIGVAGLMGWWRTRKIRICWCASAAIAVIAFGVFLNILPNFLYKTKYGENQEVALRQPMEAEIYGLKLIQLVLPRPEHRIEQLAKITKKYSGSHPLVNENFTVSLGFIGSIGLLSLGALVLRSLGGEKIDIRLGLLAAIVFLLFMFGTIGGLGAVFSTFVSPLIRGWNRISVFIAFGAIAAFFLAWQLITAKFFTSSTFPALVLSALALAAIGLYDQTTPACTTCNEQLKRAYVLDKDFIQKVEHSVPAGSSIYQLPYMPFPEFPPLHRLQTYDLAAGFLHSKSLHWNYAGMKGRDGDLFYRALSQEPIEKQLDVIRRLGFAGIYIDRRGYEDNANALVDRLSRLLSTPPALSRADGEAVFFRLPKSSNVNLSGLSHVRIMQKAGYLVDKLGSRYPADLWDGIDFTRRRWPEFVRDVEGLSGPESWGRWSDANLAPYVRISFLKSLPHTFQLVLKIQAFGPNVGKEILIRIGQQKYHTILQQDISDIHISVDTKGQSIDTIEIVPPHPASPQELGLSSDTRKLGVGLIQLRFEE